jgi:hypothetical protein
MFKQDSFGGGVTCNSGIGVGMRRAWCGGLIMGWLLLLAAPVQATEADDRYVKIYTAIQQADSLSKAGETEKAKAKYAEADKALRDLKQRYPNWNPKLVTMRQNYLADQQAKLSRPATEPEPATTVSPRATAGQTQIKLIAAGAEPLAVYRLQAAPGSQQNVKMSVAMSMTMGVPGMSGEAMKLPVIQLGAKVTTKSVADNQDVSYEAVFEKVEVAADAEAEPMLRQAMEQQMSGLKGVVVTGRLSDRYQSKQADVKLPPGVDASTRESLEQMKGTFVNPALTLPEEPIGVGAKWEVRTQQKENNINVDLVATHELTAAADGQLTIKTTTTRGATNQKIANPMMPGLQVDLTKLTGSKKEEFVLDLAKLLPVTYQSEDWSEMSMAMNQGGQRQTMTMKMEARNKLESE